MMGKSEAAVGAPFWLSMASLALLLAALALTNPTAEARYLPTRSDESELAALKDIISNILTEAVEQQQQQQQQLERDQRHIRSARFFSGVNNRARQLARQRYLMGVPSSSSKGLDDQSQPQQPGPRALLNAALVQRRSAELVAPTKVAAGGDGGPLDGALEADQAPSAYSRLQDKPQDRR